ncbi:MAG: UDP-N-acetylmuramoyl-tripeptide--D-alanyl-D-alanine ligase [bacterium]|nr:UDP-N-acetylmuramoyl-tripeptide--D-alanyl-D-alanine ligase [bacterium]
MPELAVTELLKATGGVLLRGESQITVDSYVIDTRRIREGGLFFALRGTRTDGHRFLAEAATNGATAAVVEREPESDQPLPPVLIKVDDAVAALARCGEYVRRKLSTVKWIGVTGSNGKTTTKELMAAGLSSAAKVHRTAGNFNNHLGVPLTLLACPADSEIAVIEMAMSEPGEIAELTKIVDPDVGVVTNVRAVHIENFGSLDNIAAAKGELYALLRDRATSVVNADDVHVRLQATRHVGPQITFGQHPQADLRMEDLENRFIPGARFVYRYQDQRRQVHLRIGGAHAAFNALAALAGVVAVGGDLDAAADSLEQVEPGAGRGRVHRLDRDIVVVDDSYNSSPSALASILETLRVSETTGRRVLVMGDMLELGSLEDALHREAGKRAATSGVEVLVAVGALSRATADVARRAGVPEVYHFKDAARAAGSIWDFLREGDLVVVKGSRGIHLERVVQALTSQHHGAG